MTGQEGTRLGAAVGATDRGTLWRAVGEHAHDRVVRVIEPRFCDGRFRHALAALRQRGHDRLLGIVEEGWSEGDYRVEYRVHAAWRSLEEQLAATPDWWDRLAVVADVCDAVAHWRRNPTRPLGLTLRSILVVDDGAGARPWLVPCPPITVTSPCDLFGLDATVMATLAPEVVRGTPFDDRAQDAYALGTLAAQALGCLPTRPAADRGDLVETQARGVLLRTVAPTSGLPDAVSDSAPVERLFQVIRRYRHLEPDVRPREADDLRAAITAVTDPLWLAGRLRATDPAAALRVLDRALDRAAERADLRRERCLVVADVLAEATGAEAEDLRGRLLRDLKVVVAVETGDRAPWLRMLVRIHLDRGDLVAAAAAYHEAAEADPADLDSLLGYAWCCAGLGHHEHARLIAAEAVRRIDRMARNEMLTTREARRWRDQFAEYAL